jgi:lysyl-tRNA synthetase class 2
LKQLGIDPYPSGSGADAKAADILEGFPRNEGRTVTVAGRIQTFRRHGGLSFAHVHDPSGTIQLMLQAEGLPDTSGPASLSYSDVLELVDLGDIVETRGTVIKTRRGETSVQAETFLSIRLSSSMPTVAAILQLRQ